MKIAAFDLSTTCTGCTLATMTGKVITTLTTTPIIGQNLKPEELGFLHTKRKVVTKKGEVLTAYVVTKDEVISKTEKEQRDSMVRMASEKKRLRSMAKGIDDIILSFGPDIILMEANMMFRSMNATKQLSEVAGILVGLACAHNVDVVKINVATARSRYNVSSAMIKLASERDESWLKKVDLTKETIKYLMLQEYGDHELNSNMTTDESDSLLIFDAWRRETYGGA